MGKILILTNHSYMLWRFRRALIEALMVQHEVVLSMPFVGHEADFQALGLRCIETNIDRRGINPITDGKLLKAYSRMLRQEQPDLVITYSIKPNIYGGLVCRRQGIPLCANVQGLGTAFQKPGLAQLVTALYRLAFGKVRTVFFENAANAAEFRNRHILPAEKQTIVPGAGIDLCAYPLLPYPTHTKVHFLYLGRIMKVKGMDELFAAAERLHQEGVSFILDLVGFFEDAYKDRVQQLEAAGIAKFHGFQTDPLPYYSQCDCVVLPSYHEGMSNVLLEAAATGRPIITSRIPGCQEAVEEGRSGLLTPPRDTEGLYQAMRKMLDTSREDRMEMGRLGRTKMERAFPKELVVQKTIAALGPIGQ